MNPAQSLGSTTAYNLALGGGHCFKLSIFAENGKNSISYSFFFHPRESTTPVYIYLVGRQGQIPIELDGFSTHMIRGCVNLCMSFDLGLGSIYLLFVFVFFSCISGHECSTSSMVRGAGGRGRTTTMMKYCLRHSVAGSYLHSMFYIRD